MDRVLVNAFLHPDGLRYLEGAGFEPVVVEEEDTEGSLREAPECVGLVANALLAVDESFFRLAPGIKVVGRMGVGYDNVDVEAATRHGVRLVNTPLPVIEPVAEHTFALILGLARQVVVGDRAVREGRFRRSENAPGPELARRTLGIVGMGNTGRRVAEIARLGFRMEVLYYDQVERPDAERELGVRRTSLEDLLAESDFVSLHVSLSDSTRNLIGRRALARMKKGAYLINVSRGPVVDETALLDALKSGHLAGAGLDVFCEEPPPRDHPLWSLSSLVLTPHRAGFSVESHRGCSMVVEDIVRVLRGEEPRFAVN